MSNKAHSRAARSVGARKNGTAGVAWSTPASVDESASAANARTDAEDKLWQALHARPHHTAADLAAAAGIGKSTAQKILAKWANDGSAMRTSGLAEGSRRAADLWAIAEVSLDQAAAPASAESATVEGADTANVAQAEPDTAPALPIAPVGAKPASGGLAEVADPKLADIAAPAERDPASHDVVTSADAEGAFEANESTADVEKIDSRTSPESDVSSPAVKAERLAPGALRGMVEDFLRDHPGEEFGPTAIANALGGKSSGAVSNALDKLVADGTAVRTKDKPRRFALVPAEQAVAESSEN